MYPDEVIALATMIWKVAGKGSGSKKKNLNKCKNKPVNDWTNATYYH